MWKFNGINWTWVGGTNILDDTGFYGEQGVPDLSNVPSARTFHVGGIHSSNRIYIFGGMDYSK